MSTLTIQPAPTSAEGLAQNAQAAKTVAEAAGDLIAEPKLDGWRMLAQVTDNGVRMFSRTAKEYTGRLPAVEAELAALFPAGTWLDGEAVAIRVEDGRVFNDWGVAQSALSSSTGKGAAHADKITFMAFDLLAHGGIDARPLPFRSRRALLEEALRDEPLQRVQLNAQLPATDETHAALIAAGFEGTVVKNLDAAYASGQRGKGWWKLKATHTIDAVVMGYKDGKDGFAGMVGAVEFGQFVDGVLVSRGFCSGMDMRTRLAITKDQPGWVGAVIEVAHMGAMPSGGLRHPQFKRRRTDKLATDCTFHDA